MTDKLSKQWQHMKNEMKTETKQFFKKVFIGALIFGLIVFLMFFFVKGVRAERKLLTEWTTQLVYDTTNACYQGTIRWIVMVNPSLIGQTPNMGAQRQMIMHCFCVMDKIKKQVTIKEYQKKVFDEEWTGNLFMSKALECVKEYQTLPAFFAQQGVKIDDNETKIVTPDESIDSKDELPSQKPKESEEDSTTIFQG
jgi:hypothetical protein